MASVFGQVAVLTWSCHGLYLLPPPSPLEACSFLHGLCLCNVSKGAEGCGGLHPGPADISSCTSLSSLPGTCGPVPQAGNGPQLQGESGSP